MQRLGQTSEREREFAANAAQSHNGELTLEPSAMDGLACLVRLPVA
jgi:hypothetical protein